MDRNYDKGICKFNLARQRLINTSDKVYQWLSAVIPSANYNGVVKARLEDTGKWFIDGDQFARW
jgi:hypothetical protein